MLPFIAYVVILTGDLSVHNFSSEKEACAYSADNVGRTFGVVHNSVCASTWGGKCDGDGQVELSCTLEEKVVSTQVWKVGEKK